MVEIPKERYQLPVSKMNTPPTSSTAEVTRFWGKTHEKLKLPTLTTMRSAGVQIVSFIVFSEAQGQNKSKSSTDWRFSFYKPCCIYLMAIYIYIYIYKSPLRVNKCQLCFKRDDISETWWWQHLSWRRSWFGKGLKSGANRVCDTCRTHSR